MYYFDFKAVVLELNHSEKNREQENMENFAFIQKSPFMLECQCNGKNWIYSITKCTVV